MLATKREFIPPTDRFLASHPVCERCGEPATLVDHRWPHNGDEVLMFSEGNMVAVCRDCHSLLMPWKASYGRSEEAIRD